MDHVLEQGGTTGARTTIYFTAPHRVDFRSLVRDLQRHAALPGGVAASAPPATRRASRAASARAGANRACATFPSR